MDVIFIKPPDNLGMTGLVGFLCILSTMMQLSPISTKIADKEATKFLLDQVHRLNGVLEYIVPDRDLRLTSIFTVM